MKIIDTFDDIRQCYRGGVFDLGLWESYADSISPDFRDKIKNDVKDCDFSEDILPVLQDLINNEDKLITAHDSFCRITVGLEDKISSKLGAELDVLVVFYLGLCSGAGWATEVGGRPAVLLGAEKIAELSWQDRRSMTGLLYHELGHIWHYSVRTKDFGSEAAKDRALRQLYCEGIAMYAEQLLCEDDRFYHQDADGWLAWCEANRRELCREYLRRIDSGGSVQQFFGDRCSYNGKSDIGYYLGCELVRALADGCSLRELADMELSEVEDRFREYVYNEVTL